MPNRVALVHCQTLPEPDPDADVTVAGLTAAGISADWIAWDNPDIDWASYELAILRATWNYYQAPDRFRAWIEGVSRQTRLLNPLDILLHNLHKRYLFELEAKGIPIVPTRLVRQGEAPDIPWDRFVVKPAISAGSYLTEAFTKDRLTEAQQFLQRVLEHGDALIQKFMDSVEHGGEINLIHIQGELTHGIVKRPRFSEDQESVSEAVQPDLAQVEVAKRTMATLPDPPLYARVDIMKEGDRWLLSELELIEPSLFFLQYPNALEAFVSAVRNLLG